MAIKLFKAVLKQGLASFSSLFKNSNSVATITSRNSSKLEKQKINQEPSSGHPDSIKKYQIKYEGQQGKSKESR